MGKRKIVRFQAVSRTSDSFRLSQDHEGRGYGEEGQFSHESGRQSSREYRYEYESTWVEICSTDSRADHLRRMDVLLQAVGKEIAEQFEWVAETDTIQTYEHRVTYRYLHIDSLTGEFCDQQRSLTSRERALAYALPASESSTYELATTSFTFELPLGAFVRRGPSGRDDADSSGEFALPAAARWMHVLSQIYRQLWGKLLASRDRSGSPGQERFRPEGAPLPGSERRELNLSAFTRRAA